MPHYRIRVTETRIVETVYVIEANNSDHAWSKAMIGKVLDVEPAISSTVVTRTPTKTLEVY